MTIESATYISQLVATNPASGDPKSEGDDHIRLLKSTIQATFPNINGVVSATDETLSALPGAPCGTYTPTLTNTTNVSTSAVVTPCSWSRAGSGTGSVITVAGRVSIAPTAGAGAQILLDMSLPVASAFTSSGQLGGTAANNTSAANSPGSVIANTATGNAALQFFATSTATCNWFFHFTYVVA